MRAAAELGVPKVVFASSNHVTDVYERAAILCWGGRSTQMTTRSPKLVRLAKLASEISATFLAPIRRQGFRHQSADRDSC
ncbi:hypothetical protein PO124_18490 [Bacillus licheniformis]|nr:hypothetical protein [Bacillus licheniformis]